MWSTGESNFIAKCFTCVGSVCGGLLSFDKRPLLIFNQFICDTTIDQSQQIHSKIQAQDSMALMGKGDITGLRE